MPSIKVNKVPYDFASLEVAFTADGEPLPITNGITELNYSDTFEREKLRGTDRFPIAATDGEYDAEASCTFHKFSYDVINDHAKAKGVGVYDIVFTISVAYIHKGLVVRTDTITGVRIAGREMGHSQGPDPLLVACELFIADRIYIDGLGPDGQTL